MGIGIEPLGSMVLIELEKAPEKTTGGLLLPEEAREKMNVGKVIAVGPGATRDDGTVAPMSVNAGDRVIYRKYAGTEIQWMGMDYLLTKEEDLQAKLLNE